MRRWFCPISLMVAFSAILARRCSPAKRAVYLQLSPTVKAVLVHAGCERKSAGRGAQHARRRQTA
jgi:hypothetical protein